MTTRLEACLPTAWARGMPTIQDDQPDAFSDAQLLCLEASFHQRYSVSAGSASSSLADRGIGRSRSSSAPRE